MATMTAQVPSSPAVRRDAARVEPARATLGERERRVALALAEAVMPSRPEGRVPGADAATIVRYERLLAGLGTAAVRAAGASLVALDAVALLRTGHTLAGLPVGARAHLVAGWAEGDGAAARWALRAVLTPLKAAHFDDARVASSVGCRNGVERPAARERAAWMRQVIDGRATTEDLSLDCEVVVVGTGAGGAATAYELARRGRAVLLVEAGRFHDRSEYDGRSVPAYGRSYGASTVALGNVAMPILAGRGVGGTTTINSGTCYRAPEWTLARWGSAYGLSMLSPSGLAPYYERVESMLGVALSPAHLLGGSARVVARGADALGLSHGPLARNAPGCDGQGVCCFGCPTGAKTSTDVSYVPAALARGAQLVTDARVRRIEVEGGRARGLVARLASGRTLTVRAEAVVVAAGTLATPLLLEASGLCTRSGWLGKNLSVHPAAKVMALMRETIDMSQGIPQSYAIDEHAREGLMFEGASTPLDVTAVAVPWVGPRFMELLDRYPRLATFGLMMQDHGRGTVRRGPRGVPVVRYHMPPGDVARVQRGIELLSEVFFRAGAERVMPMVAGFDELRDERDLERLRRSRLRAGDLELSAYHPLGTCRMGTDPERSCVGPDHEAHDVAGLFVTDGSAVPSSLGVNPQLTIMALAVRAAEQLDARLDRLGGSAPRSAETPAKREGRRATFTETMSGTYRAAGSPERARPLTFTVRALSLPLRELSRAIHLDLDGELSAEELGAHLPVTGSLTIDLLGRREIAYDVSFTTAAGAPCRLAGAKTVTPRALLRSMTFLPARLLDAGGAELGTAELWFDARRDLFAFVKSMGLARVARPAA